MKIKQTVLIVDDVIDNINVVAGILIKEDINVQVAQNGKDAILAAKKNIPDLILLDIMMPEMNGFEVCEILKADLITKDIPIIFLSAKTETESIIEGFKKGAVDYLSKPFVEQELVVRVKTHLRLQQTTQELIMHKNNLEELVADRVIKLRTSRNNFRNIFESSSDAIFITDLKGNFINGNRTTIERTGFSEKELKNINLIGFHKGDDLNPVEEYFKNIINNKQSVLRTNYKNKTGNTIYVEIRGTLITYDDKNSILHVSRDITERKVREKQKLNLIIETEENERKRFAKDIHDGLGAVLSAAKMYLNIAKRCKNDPNKAQKMLIEAINLIDQAGKNAKEIAVNIRPHDLSHFSLATSLHNFCERLNSIGNYKVNFEAESYEQMLEDDIKVNLYRAINELINNTIKYADGKNINIKMYQQENTIIIEYNDDGKGFDFKKIMKSSTKGTGIENILHRIKLIGGHAQINSEPGKGTWAIIRF